MKKKKITEIYYHAMLLPGMIFLFIFSYLPMFGVVMAFQNFKPAKGILKSEWVGLDNFVNIFTGRDFWHLVRNTVTISSGKMITTIVVAIAFSILLNEIRIKWLKKSVQTIVYLPHFLSWVIFAGVVSQVLNLDGIINHLIVSMGLPKVNFLGDKRLFQPLLIITDVWKEFGYSSIVYLAAITSVDPGLHEAAAIDGATWFKRVWHVTLPAMLPIIIFMAALSITGILSAGFDQVFNLYSTPVYEVADILDTYIYRIGLVGRQYDVGASMGLVRSVIGLILMLLVNKLSIKYAHRTVF